MNGTCENSVKLERVCVNAFQEVSAFCLQNKRQKNPSNTNRTCTLMLRTGGLILKALTGNELDNLI